MYRVVSGNMWAIIDDRGVICNGSQYEMEDIFEDIVAGKDGGDYYDETDLHPPILLVCVIKQAE